MRIQDVECRTGLDRATIRFYEKEGLVMPLREENGYRIYSENDLMILLKIKLLRQLGVSLVKIKGLQQGSCEFTQILTEQIEILESQIQADSRAKIVCCEIRDAGVRYDNLDALCYLQMLTSAPIGTVHPFTEPVKREVHPWRRYFARYLDYRIITAVMHLIFIVILRIRPFTSDGIQFLNYVSVFVAVPILASMLHFFGTTPGKWAMGIRLESIYGGKLSGGEALYREGKIIWHGLGLLIPILNIWCEYRSYRDETEGIPQSWNEDSEIIYTEWSVFKKAMAAGILIITILISLFAGFDTFMPTYRGSGITLDEFVENYNDYASVPYAQSSIVLGDDGKWVEVIAESPEPERPEFIYQIDKYGNIVSISYEVGWESEQFEFGLPLYCEKAIYAVVGSRPGGNYHDLQKVDRLLNEELYGKLAGQEGTGEGSFIIEDVKVSWKTEIRNCDFVQDKVLFAADNTTMFFTIKLLIEIL